MREFEPTMNAQVDVFLAQLLRTSQHGEIVEMTSRCKYLATDVIDLLAFGTSWNADRRDAASAAQDICFAQPPGVPVHELAKDAQV